MDASASVDQNHVVCRSLEVGQSEGSVRRLGPRVHFGRSGGFNLLMGGLGRSFGTFHCKRPEFDKISTKNANGTFSYKILTQKTFFI